MCDDEEPDDLTLGLRAEEYIVLRNEMAGEKTLVQNLRNEVEALREAGFGAVTALTEANTTLQELLRERK